MTSESKILFSFLKRLPTAVVVADTASGEILWVNGPHPELTGATTPEAVVGTNLFQHLGPDQLAIAMRDVEAVSRGETPPPVVYRIKRLDGGTSDVSIASVPVTYEGRSAMVSVLTDVSESERLKRELARSESHFRTITDNSPWALVVVRGEEIVYANRRVAGVLGRPDTEDVTGTMLFEYLDNASRSRLRRARDRVLGGGVEEVDVALGILAADGPSVSMRAVISPIEWDGQAVYRITIRPHRSTD